MASQPSPIPKNLSAELAQYDPLVRIRWATQENCWRVERKIRRGQPIEPRLRRRWDDWQCFREGYVLVFRVPPECGLDRRVLLSLQIGDIQRLGARAYADELDKQDARYFANVSRAEHLHWAHRSRELYEHLKWRNRERVGMATNIRGGIL